MAKKFVRGVTGVDDIEKLDKSLTNVNDLVSDGKNTYVHTKKGKVESYYNLTDNVKKVQESDETINVETDGNGTVNLSTNPKKVLQHDNLLTGYGLRKDTDNNKTTISIDTVSVADGFDLNNFNSGFIRASFFTNAPYNNTPFYVVSLGSLTGSSIQIAFKRINSNVELNQIFLRTKLVGVNIWSDWKQYGIDNNTLNTMLASKQNTLTNNTSIGVNGSGLQQLYSLKQTYSVTGGLLKTHVKSVSQNTSVSSAEEEFNFIVKINKGVSSVNFTLNTHNTTKFANIMSLYGENNTVRISGCVFTLNGSTLTVSTTNNSQQNYVITFSDII